MELQLPHDRGTDNMAGGLHHHSRDLVHLPSMRDVSRWTPRWPLATLVLEIASQQSGASGQSGYHGEEETGDGIHSILGDRYRDARDFGVYYSAHIYRGRVLRKSAVPSERRFRFGAMVKLHTALVIDLNAGFVGFRRGALILKNSLGLVLQASRFTAFPSLPCLL